MLMLLNVLSIFKLVLIISRLYFLIEKEIYMGYTLSRRKHGRNISPSPRRVDVLTLYHTSTATDQII